MQIRNNPQIPTQTTSPNFKAIKTIKCEGLYKKHPDLAKNLVDAFKENPKAMDFCKKFDVNIIFYACKQAMSAVESSIHIFFDNPAKTKFLGIFGSKKDSISLSNYDDKYEIVKSLEATTEGLKNYISDHIPNENSGLLNSHIKLKEEEIQKVLDAKEQKILAKESRLNAKQIENYNRKENKAALDNSIEDLINKSNS